MVHFEDTPDDAVFRAAAREWLAAHASARRGEGDWSNGPSDHTLDAEREFFERCRAWQRTLYDAGWVTDRCKSAWQRVIFEQEMARFDCTAGFIASTIGMTRAVLTTHGTADQQERYLTRLLRGDDAWCQLFSEPDAGSDLANLATRADRDGDSYVVNGQKVWTSNAHLCDWGMLIARTDPDVPKHKGISFFVINMHTPGIDVRPLRQISGHTHFNEVFLTEVRVPAANRIGGENEGWAAARTVLGSEVTQIGTTVNSASAAALCALARELGVSADKRVRQGLARAHTEERLLEWMINRVLTTVRQGRPPAIDPSALKVFWSEQRARKDTYALHVLGAAGMLSGHDAPRAGLWQTLMLNQFWGTVGGGTSEVHRNMIGERALGLPPEPRVDKDLTYRASRTPR